MRPNCLVPSRVVPSEPWPKAGTLLERIEWGRAFLELCQHQTRWIEDARGETPNCKLPLLQKIFTKALESPKTSSKESFELDLRQGIFNCLVLLMLVLVPTKVDPIVEEQRSLGTEVSYAESASHLGCCVWLNLAEPFGGSEVPLLQMECGWCQRRRWYWHGPCTSRGLSRWRAGSKRLLWPWRKESMQSFVIFCRSLSVYLVGAGVGIDTSGGLVSLGAAGVLIVSAKSSSSSRLSYPAKRGGAFCQTELLQTGWLTHWVWSF